MVDHWLSLTSNTTTVIVVPSSNRGRLCPWTRRWLDADERAAWLRLVAVVELLPGVLDAQLRRDAGLTHFEYFVLAMLSEAPERTLRMTALAHRTNATLPRLSHVVQRLEDARPRRAVPLPRGPARHQRPAHRRRLGRGRRRRPRTRRHRPRARARPALAQPARAARGDRRRPADPARPRRHDAISPRPRRTTRGLNRSEAKSSPRHHCRTARRTSARSVAFSREWRGSDGRGRRRRPGRRRGPRRSRRRAGGARPWRAASGRRRSRCR